ncbi:MAG: acyltransferase [Thermomonas haemolytica]
MNTILLYLWSLLCPLLPATRLFRVKRGLLRLAGAQVAGKVRIVSSARFQLTGKLQIGNDTWIGHEVLVVGGNAPVAIGANCDIAPRVTIATGTHRIDPAGPRVAGAGDSLPVRIGDGCWICAGATILGGTRIGAHSIVAAGAVVRGEFPPRALIGGVPARVIRPIDGFHAQDENA